MMFSHKEDIAMKHKGAAFWQERINEWRASGLSQARYCRRMGFAPSTFKLWLRKLREDQEDDAGIDAPVVVQVPCETHSKPPMQPFRLYAPNGWRIDVFPGFCGRTLRELMSVVKV